MKNLWIILLAVAISSCSSFQGCEEEEKEVKDTPEEVYVFDEVSNTKKNQEIDDLKKEVDNSLNTNKTEVSSNNTITSGSAFYLQLGAFSALNKAEQYIKENASKVPFTMSIVYNNKTGFYNVRSTQYSTKSEAQMIKEGFWRQNMFKDAFIVTE